MQSGAVDVAILAGGAATRFGGAVKPLLVLGGRAVIERQRAALLALGPRVRELFVVANDPAPLSPLGLRVVPDLRPGLGPLAGLEAALTAATADHVLVVAGDMPLLDPRLLRLIVDADPAAEVVVPMSRRGPEPLCARYARSVLPRVSRALDARRLALHRLLDELDPMRLPEERLREVDPALVTFENVNAPEDLERLARLVERSDRADP